MSSTQWIAVASVAAVVASALAIFAGLRSVRDQLRVSVFLTYTERYGKIMNSIPFEARQPGSSYQLGSRPDKERTRVLAAFREYFNLCSEEKWLHDHRKIDHATWEIWVRGMQVVANFPCFRSCWETLAFEYHGYKEFQDFIEATLLSGETTSNPEKQSILEARPSTADRSVPAADPLTRNGSGRASILPGAKTPEHSSPPGLKASSVTDNPEPSASRTSHALAIRRPTRTTRAKVSAIQARLDNTLSSISDLDRSIKQFYYSRPYTLAVESNWSGLKHTAYIAFTEQPPEALGAKIIVIVHQLRSVLDDVANLLASGKGNARSTQFPICNDSVQYYDGIDGRPPLVEAFEAISNSRVRSFIDGVQPFRRQDRRGLHDDLWVLDRLSAIYSQQNPLLTHAVTHGSHLRFVAPSNYVPREIFKVGTLRPGDKSRAKLVTMFLDAPQSRVEIEVRPALTIAFDEREIARNRFVRKTLINSWFATKYVTDNLCRLIPLL